MNAKTLGKLSNVEPAELSRWFTNKAPLSAANLRNIETVMEMPYDHFQQHLNDTDLGSRAGFMIGKRQYQQGKSLYDDYLQFFDSPIRPVFESSELRLKSRQTSIEFIQWRPMANSEPFGREKMSWSEKLLVVDVYDQAKVRSDYLFEDKNRVRSDYEININIISSGIVDQISTDTSISKINRATYLQSNGKVIPITFNVSNVVESISLEYVIINGFQRDNQSFAVKGPAGVNVGELQLKIDFEPILEMTEFTELPRAQYISSDTLTTDEVKYKKYSDHGVFLAKYKNPGPEGRLLANWGLAKI